MVKYILGNLFQTVPIRAYMAWSLALDLCFVLLGLAPNLPWGTIWYT